jgi:hypothetical protein
MASVTLHTSVFPAGTTVQAHLRRTDQPPSGAPPTTAEDTATVSAAGALTFDGLTELERYWAYAQVGSDHVYLGFEADPGTGAEEQGVEIAASYDAAGSYQPVAADLELGAGAGAGAGDSAFLAALMGNLLGADLTKTNNYLAGVIGSLSVTGTKAALFQVGGVVGIIMDGVSQADAAVVAVIDGSDPSSVTRATAAFAARMNNNNAGSGVDYGLDLTDAGRGANQMTGGRALPIAKADLRLSNEVCIFSKAGVPGSGDGAGYAEKGSLCTDRTNGKLYVNTGTKATPTWTVAGTQS